MIRVRPLLCLLLIVSLQACSDKSDIHLFDGQFTGKFYYVSKANSMDTSVNASISFSGNNFTSPGGINHIPAGGSGTFDIEKGQFVNFKDTNVWTADFDWGLILNGKYEYQFEGDSLILNRYIGPCSPFDQCVTISKIFQYRLKRIN